MYSMSDLAEAAVTEAAANNSTWLETPVNFPEGYDPSMDLCAHCHTEYKADLGMCPHCKGGRNLPKTYVLRNTSIWEDHGNGSMTMLLTSDENYEEAVRQIVDRDGLTAVVWAQKDGTWRSIPNPEYNWPATVTVHWVGQYGYPETADEYVARCKDQHMQFNFVVVAPKP